MLFPQSSNLILLIHISIIYQCFRHNQSKQLSFSESNFTKGPRCLTNSGNSSAKNKIYKKPEDESSVSTMSSSKAEELSSDHSFFADLSKQNTSDESESSFNI